MRSRLILWSCICAVTACGPPVPPPTPPPEKKAPQELVIALPPGPTTWFAGAKGDAAGLDRDLADLFAKALGLSLRVIAVDSPAQLIAAIVSGEAHIGAGGLYGPLGMDGGAAFSPLLS